MPSQRSQDHGSDGRDWGASRWASVRAVRAAAGGMALEQFRLGGQVRKGPE